MQIYLSKVGCDVISDLHWNLFLNFWKENIFFLIALPNKANVLHEGIFIYPDNFLLASETVSHFWTCSISLKGK